jgi:hypothetical protein
MSVAVIYGNVRNANPTSNTNSGHGYALSLRVLVHKFGNLGDELGNAEWLGDDIIL